VAEPGVCVHKNIFRAFRQFLLRHEIAVGLELLLLPAVRGAPDDDRLPAIGFAAIDEVARAFVLIHAARRDVQANEIVERLRQIHRQRLVLWGTRICGLCQTYA
jgi:hypothetical protein